MMLVVGMLIAGILVAVAVAVLGHLELVTSRHGIRQLTKELVDEAAACLLAKKGLELLQVRVDILQTELLTAHAEVAQALALSVAQLDNSIKLVEQLLEATSGLTEPAPRYGWRAPPPPAELPPPAPAAPDPDADRKWGKVMEAITERGSGNPGLMNQLTADAHRWRRAGTPLEEIESRIWNGWDGREPEHAHVERGGE